MDPQSTPDPLAALGDLTGPVARRIELLDSSGFLTRLWERDPTLWSDSPDGRAEASRRLGWIDTPANARARIPLYRRFANGIHSEHIGRFLILGMGGSSLASEVVSSVFAGDPATSGNRLGILDSTDPLQVVQSARDFPPKSSLYVVSSKSGGTAEVMAAFEYFWMLTGGDGSRFIAISDEGTSLAAMARERGFREVFNADASVGGRYSALTDFGMVPAALLGVDLERFVDRAVRMQQLCGREVPGRKNPALVLGALMGESAARGRDKLTLLADPELTSLPGWIEQLVAESSGKDGKGIVPIAQEPLDLPECYGADRVFVYLRRGGTLDAAVTALHHAGFPVFTVDVADAYDIAAEFFRWEVAVAAACHIIGVHAFDQPDVQESKERTQAKIGLMQKGAWHDEGPWHVDFLAAQDGAPGAALRAFLMQARKGDYIAINAYLPMQNVAREELQRIRVWAREQTHAATTVGFGPRFQHSTGQLHKGGPNTGLFMQIVCEPGLELRIPGSQLTFGGLIRAQAQGDYETLVARHRRVVRVRLSGLDDLTTLRRMLNDPTL